MTARLRFVIASSARPRRLCRRGSRATPTPVQFGAWTPGSPFGGERQRRSTSSRARSSAASRSSTGSRTGRVDAHHFRWNVTKAVRGIRRSGRTPMLTWEPYAPGPWEPYTNQRDRRRHATTTTSASGPAACKRLKRPDLRPLRPRDERQLVPLGRPGQRQQPRRPSSAMWRHVVDVARSAGAHNVSWVWSPLRRGRARPAASFERYYPGRSYVDVIGLIGLQLGRRRAAVRRLAHVQEDLQQALQADHASSARSRSGSPRSARRPTAATSTSGSATCSDRRASGTASRRSSGTTRTRSATGRRRQRLLRLQGLIFTVRWRTFGALARPSTSRTPSRPRALCGAAPSAQSAAATACSRERSRCAPGPSVTPTPAAPGRAQLDTRTRERDTRTRTPVRRRLRSADACRPG